MECLNCDIRAKENIRLHKEINRLTTLLADKDQQLLEENLQVKRLESLCQSECCTAT